MAKIEVGVHEGIPMMPNFRSAGAPTQPKAKVTPESRDLCMDLLSKHPDYDEYKWSWDKLRLIMEGSDAMKEWDIGFSKGKPCKESFLIRPPAQTDPEYAFYVWNGRFFNAFSHTIEVLMGFFFYRDPKVDAPVEMQPILDNIDRRGSTFLDFAKKVAREILHVGRCGVLVDYPRMPSDRVLSAADVKKLGMRPFLRFYKAEDIYNWEFTIINNVRTLSRVVLRETVGNYAWDQTALMRVIELEPQNIDEFGVPADWVYRSTLYQLSKTKETMFMKKQDKNVEFTSANMLDTATPSKADGSFFNTLPFLFGGLTGDQTETQRPPLLDIANLNIDHYRKCADISSALFHCAHPTAIFCGFTFENGQAVRLGAHQGITTKDPAAHASYLELNGQSITEIRKECEAIMMELASAGAKVMVSANAGSNQTAETSRIQASGETSVMNTLSSTLSQFFTQLLTMQAQWLDTTSNGIAVNMNREFLPYKMDSQDVIALVNAVENNVMPLPDVLEALKNGGVVSATRTLADYLKDLEVQREAADARTAANAASAAAAKPAAKPTKPAAQAAVSPSVDDENRKTGPTVNA